MSPFASSTLRQPAATAATISSPRLAPSKFAAASAWARFKRWSIRVAPSLPPSRFSRASPTQWCSLLRESKVCWRHCSSSAQTRSLSATTCASMLGSSMQHSPVHGVPRSPTPRSIPSRSLADCYATKCPTANSAPWQHAFGWPINQATEPSTTRSPQPTCCICSSNAPRRLA